MSRAALVALALGALVACTATPEEEVNREPAFVRSTSTLAASGAGHWSQRFAPQAVLVADRILIEGPDDLSTHLVVMHASEWLESETHTTPEGLVQEVSVSDEAAGVVIRAQLGGWSLAAMRSIRVLQRPDRGAVRIVAEGDASWIPVDGGADRRGPRLVFSSDEREP